MDYYFGQCARCYRAGMMRHGGTLCDDCRTIYLTEMKVRLSAKFRGPSPLKRAYRPVLCYMHVQRLLDKALS